MVTDYRQQELFANWFKLGSDEFADWIEQQPDKEELFRLLSYYWAYSSKHEMAATMVRAKMARGISSSSKAGTTERVAGAGERKYFSYPPQKNYQPGVPLLSGKHE